MTIPLFDVPTTDYEYDGDPPNPDMIDVTPPEIVARLTASEREERVKRLIEQAMFIVARFGSEWSLFDSGLSDEAVRTRPYRHKGRPPPRLARGESGQPR